jgi:hypothetical protein
MKKNVVLFVVKLTVVNLIGFNETGTRKTSFAQGNAVMIIPKKVKLFLATGAACWSPENNLNSARLKMPSVINHVLLHTTTL